MTVKTRSSCLGIIKNNFAAQIKTCDMEYDIYCQVCGAELNLQSVVSVVQQTLRRLNTTKQEVSKLWSRHQSRIQQQQEYCRKYREKLLKVLLYFCIEMK